MLIGDCLVFIYTSLATMAPAYQLGLHVDTYTLVLPHTCKAPEFSV